MRRHSLVCVVALSVVVASGSAEAGIGQLLRKGSQYVGKQVRKFADEGAEVGAKSADDVVEHAASRATGKAVTASADVGKHAAVQASKEASGLGLTATEVAIGATATAVVLAPDAFVQAGENVVTTAISTAGEHLMQPFVTQAAANFPWTLAWCLLLVVSAACLLLRRLKRSK